VTPAPVVPMLFRRAAGPASARAFAAGAMGWPEIGGDGDLYDAGNAMVGFGFQASEMSPGVCSRENLRPVETGLNPASELRVAAADFEGAARRVAEALEWPRAALTGAVRHDREGASLSFYDATGNLTTLLGARWRAHTGRSGRRLGALLPDDGAPPAVVGMTLHVAELGRSLRFYREVLGLPALRVTPREARLEAGPLILTLAAEREVGTVADARRRGALRDSVILLVEALDAGVDALAGRGVEFPLGVEECRAARRKAFFFDPDGHRLVLWEPPRAAPPGTPAAEYLPTLERILARHAAEPSSIPALEGR
jgi:catechol 2,3-dioxygenase-like lactoylglutathione lyase family enzyme